MKLAENFTHVPMCSVCKTHHLQGNTVHIIVLCWDMREVFCKFYFILILCTCWISTYFIFRFGNSKHPENNKSNVQCTQHTQLFKMRLLCSAQLRQTAVVLYMYYLNLIYKPVILMSLSFYIVHHSKPKNIHDEWEAFNMLSTKWVFLLTECCIWQSVINYLV